jgi:hypothetical protein
MYICAYIKVTEVKLRWEIEAGRVGLIDGIYVVVKRTSLSYVRFQFFAVVTVKNADCWDVTPCCSCENRHYGGPTFLRNMSVTVRNRLQLSCSPDRHRITY